MTFTNKRVYKGVWDKIGISIGNSLSKTLNESIRSSLKTDLWFALYEDTWTHMEGIAVGIIDEVKDYEFNRKD